MIWKEEKNAAGDFFYIDKYLKIGTAQTNTAFANREASDCSNR